MQQIGIARGQMAGALRRLDLRQQAFDRRRQDRFHQPRQARVAGTIFPQHELMEIRMRDREAEEGDIFRPQAFDWAHLSVIRGFRIPEPPDLGEGVFRHRLPENFLGAEMIGDQRMLQAGAQRDVADARGIEAAFPEFGKRRAQNGLAGFDRALLRDIVEALGAAR